MDVYEHLPITLVLLIILPLLPFLLFGFGISVLDQSLLYLFQVLVGFVLVIAPVVRALVYIVGIALYFGQEAIRKKTKRLIHKVIGIVICLHALIFW